MADENQQTPQVGPVSQNQPGNAQQPNVQRGVPGVQQPPTPSQEEIQRVMREQQERQQKEIAEAKARADALKNQYQQPQPQSAPNSRIGQQAPQQAPQQHQVPAYIQQQLPPEMQNAAAQATGQSTPQGMSPEQVFAGFPQQQPPMQYAQQPQYQQPQQAPQQPQYQQPQQQGNQFESHAQPQNIEKVVVYWHPARSQGVDIELTDTIIKAVPREGMAVESDPQAKVVLALFSEILALREELAMRQAPQIPQDLDMRVRRLEGALFEQANAMNQRARSVREQIQMLQSRGLSADQVLQELNGISVAAEQKVAQQGRTEEPAPQEAESPAQEAPNQG